MSEEREKSGEVDTVKEFEQCVIAGASKSAIADSSVLRAYESRDR